MMLVLLVSAVLLLDTVSAPPTRLCYVKTVDYYGEERSECGTGELKSLGQLARNPVPEDKAFGTANEADLILARGGAFDVNQGDLENKYICRKHQEALGLGWTTSRMNRPRVRSGTTMKEKCNMPGNLYGYMAEHGAVAANPYAYLSKEGAKAIWTRDYILVPVGTAMCRRHQNFVNQLVPIEQPAELGPLEEAEEEEQEVEGEGDAAAEAGRNVGGYNLRERPRQGTSYAQSPVRTSRWRHAGQSRDVCAASTSSQSEAGSQSVGGSQSLFGSQPVCGSQGSGSSYQPSLGSQQLSQGALSPATIPKRRQECRKVEQGVRTIADAIGIPQDKVNFPQCFSTLADRTKAMRTIVAGKITDAVMSSFAPDAPKELMERVVEKRAGGIYDRKKTEKCIGWIENVIDQYMMAPTRHLRMHILASLAPVLSYVEMQTYVPGLTRYAYKEARRYAAMMKAGLPTRPPPSTIREKYDAKKIEVFIAFITSSLVVSDMPFGQVTVRKSTGEKVEMPNLLRTTVNARIIALYKAFLKDSGKQDEAISDSTMWRILDGCKATTRKSLLGLDYITYSGIEGIANLMNLTEQIKEKDGDADWAKDTQRVLKELKAFLKSDYKMYIQQDSDIADYSRNYALSDPKEESLRAAGLAERPPLRRCAMCIAMMNMFKEMQDKINDVLQEIEKREAEFVLDKSKYDILEWQKHVMRTSNQNEGKDEILQNLKNDEAWMLMDWAMKFLPKKGIESQTEWFGKRGISWHISVVFAKLGTRDFMQRTFVHIFDPVAQDAEAVLAIIEDSITRMKSEMPGLKKIYLRSDNAGCYHSGPTLTALPLISQKTGVKIARYDFSDPQSGKGPCDRATSVIKRHVKIYIAENHACSTAAQLLQCAGSHGGVKTTTFIHAALQAPPGKAGKGSIPLITSYHNFDFTGQRMRVWNAYKIGQGKEIRVTERTQELPRLTVHAVTTRGNDQREPFRNLDHWVTLEGKSIPVAERTPAAVTSNDGWVPDETDYDDGGGDNEPSSAGAADSDVPDEIEGPHRQRLYPCEEEGCTKVFQRFYNWYRHVSVGKHTFQKERQSLRDFSIDQYVKMIQLNQVQSGIPADVAALRSQRDEEARNNEEAAAAYPLQVGWALKVRRETKRFTLEQKQYLDTKFDEGIGRGQKYDPHDVATEMRRQPQFPTKEHWLTWQQISSYWSRIAKEREQRSNQGQGSTQRQGTAAASVTEASEDYDLEEMVDDEHANEYNEHIEEIIEEVLATLRGPQ